MSTNHNDVLSAFINQTYGSLEKAQKADKLADKNPNAQPEHDEYFNDRGNHNLEKETDEKLQQEVGGRILLNKQIKDSMHIPTQIQDGALDHKTEAHANFKGYDHSLEQHRGHKLELIKLRDMPSGSVDEMYDNMFDNDSNLVE